MRIVIGLTLAFLSLIGPATSNAMEERDYGKQLYAKVHPDDAALARGWQDVLDTTLAALAREGDDPLSLEAIPEFERLRTAPHLEFDIAELDGDWQMRSLQASPLGAFIYPYFPARIYPEARAYVFEKDSGSQRHQGLLAQRDAETVFFVGALYYGDEEPRTYSALSAVPTPSEMDAVAEIYKIGDNHFLMAFAPGEASVRLYEIRK